MLEENKEFDQILGGPSNAAYFATLATEGAVLERIYGEESQGQLFPAVLRQQHDGRSRCKQIVRCREPAKLMTAERTQWLTISTREIVTHDDRQVQRLGNTFDPADQIDGGADHGEIESVGRADISVDHGADVKRYDDLERRLVHK